MRCKITITAVTDIASWVHRDVFMRNVDMDDLNCRESAEVYDWYHPSWFIYQNGDRYFIPPAFIFRDGRLSGINGRHRAILLARHMEIFPMLVVCRSIWPAHKFSEIVNRQIGEGDTIELPDLPINDPVLQ